MKNKKLKYAFGILLSLVGLSLFSGILFLESGRFAKIVKDAISERSPKSLGVVGDFSNLKLYFFPPGVGLVNPRVQINKNNVSRLPIEGAIEASELRLHFEPIQMLSGTLQVSRILVKEGSVTVKAGADVFKPRPSRKKSPSLSWDEILELQINGVEFENTYLSVEIELPDNPGKHFRSELVVNHLVAFKEKEDQKSILRSQGLMNAVKMDFPEEVIRFPIKTATEIEWDLKLTDEGVELNPFRIQLLGMSLTAQGNVKGSIFKPGAGLNFEGESSLKSDLGEFFSAYQISEDVSGSVEAKLRVTGDLRDVEKTLKGKYEVSGSDLRWKDATANRIEGSGNLDLDSGRIEVSDLRLFEKSNNAEGGEIRIREALLPLKSPLEGMKAKIELIKAPMHWAGGAVLKSVYPLEGEISGTTELISGKKKLDILTDLSIRRFALNNQKYGKVKPKHMILQPRETVHVKGSLLAQSGRLDLQKIDVILNKFKLNVGGSITDKEGIQLKANGPVDLSEMNQIAEIPIRGIGNLSVHVQGDSDGVILDFDPDLKEAEYLDLKIGEVKGRITYDSYADELRFGQIKARNNKTFYSMNDGIIDLGDSSDLELPFQIHSGKVEDLTTILGAMIRKVSWFPMELRGDLHGQVVIHGKTDFQNMIIESSLEGVDWNLYGERARKVKMNLGYDRGTYYARDLVLSKTGGVVRGMIEFDSRKEELLWNFGTESFSLNDFDFFTRLEIPARSRIDLKSTGSGKIDHLVSNTNGRFYQTFIKGEILAPTTFNLDVGESTLRASVEVFGGHARSSLKYALTPKQPSSLILDFNQFDFSPMLLILNPKLLDDPSLLGILDGRIQFDFLSTQFELAKGEVRLNRYEVSKTGFSFKLKESVQLPIELGYFNLPQTHLLFNDSEMVLSGEGRRGEIDLRLKGQLDLAISEILSSSIQKANGKADTEIRISGPLKDLRFNGDLEMSGATVQMSWMQTPFEELEGSLKIRQNVIHVDQLNAFLGEESFGLNGKIETFAQKFPILDLRARFSDNKLKLPPLELVQVRGALQIKGDSPPYLISGFLDVPQALWTRSFSQSGAGSGKSERFAPQDLDRQVSNGLFSLDLNINAPQGFLLRNEVMDGEFRGKVRLIGSPDRPRLLGEAQLVQGKVLFRDRPFILETVRVVFDDPYAMNPKFNAVAVSEISPYKIRVLASGVSSSWKAEFSSTPYLSESEIFSLLASGLTTTSNSRFRTRDRSYVNQGEAASLVLHSLDFGKDFQSKTGFQFDVEEAVDTQSASSIFRPQSSSDNVAAPKLVIKRQVGRKIGLAFGSTVGVGSQVQREVNAEYKLNNSVSVLGVWNNIEEANNRETRTSFGLDLKLNRRFK